VLAKDNNPGQSSITQHERRYSLREAALCGVVVVLRGVSPTVDARVATRYEKLAENYVAMVTLAAIMLWIA
jgi:hypothetical protein